MTNKESQETYYYVRVKHKDEFTDAIRNGERKFDEETARDIMRVAQEKNLLAFMFRKDTEEAKPVQVMRTNPEPTGIEL